MVLKGSVNFGPRGSTALGFGGHAHRAFPGGSVQFSGDEGGDIIGNKLVHYWDESNKTYDISGFKWEFE